MPLEIILVAFRRLSSKESLALVFFRLNSAPPFQTKLSTKKTDKKKRKKRKEGKRKMGTPKDRRKEIKMGLFTCMGLICALKKSWAIR